MRARTPWHARTPGGALTHLLIGVVLALAGLTLVSPATAPPAAATQGTLGQGIHVPLPGYGSTWLGAFEPPTGSDGRMSWCIQMWVAPGVGAPPVTVTAHDDPVLAWVVETYADPADALAQAAVAYTVHQRAEVPGVVANGDVTQAKRLLADAAPAEVRERSAAMVAAAVAQSGPYQDATPVVRSGDLRYGDLTGLGVLSASGAWVRDLEVTAELLQRDAAGDLVPTDRAVFDTDADRRAGPDESATWSGRTPDGPLTLHYAASGVGDVVARVRFTGLRTTRLVLYGMDGSRQDNLSLSPGLPGEPTERPAPPAEFSVANGFRVTGTSAVEDAILDADAPACDTLDLRAAPGYSWLSIEGTPVTVPLVATLWRSGLRPSAELADAPADAEQVDTVRIDATGPGVYRACADPTAVAATDPGILTWQWRTDHAAMPTDRRAVLLSAWQDTFGLPDESSSLRHTPEVVTSLSVRATSDGLRLIDDLWAEGYPSDHGDFSGGAGFGADRPVERTELWFFPSDVPVADSALDDGTARLIGSVERPAVNGFQTLSAPAFAWPSEADTDGDGVLDLEPGTVAARTVFAGDDRTAPMTTSVTDPTEQFTLVPALPGSEPLALATTIRVDGDPVSGAELVLRDATGITGTVPAEGVLLANDLYRWTGDTPVCSPETRVVAGDPVLVTTAGRQLTPSTTLTAEPGVSYGYVETARNPDGQVLHRGECGADSETIRIPAPPEVETTARAGSDRPTLGDELWDSISWRGEFPSGATTTAELFHVPDGQELRCTPETRVWTSAPLIIDRSPGSADTDRYRTTAPGSYGFVETTRDRDGEVISTGVCGEPSETLTVADVPGATTPSLLATTGTTVRVLAAVGLTAVVVGAGAIGLRRRRPAVVPSAPSTAG
ncbi:hypothetical protein [Cellulomonas sp. RIT-PI-Y]|uniref:hypothetical protein n=1 Tax=Cellulomonas sp. RIT-PI-Y TaxID=3035297 RepID=UPI0021DA2BD4|nr:hypothetical protein [Cellulomonas sp. RIT-PI-Y]